MPYVTSFERLAKEEGLQEGIQKGLRDGLLPGIELALEAKFGAASKKLMGDIRAIEDVAKLQKVMRALKKAKDLDDIYRVVRR